MAEARKIMFSHRRALGDGVMFTAGVRDFKLLFPEIEVGVDSNQPYLWHNNPHINHDMKRSDPGVEMYRVGYPAVGPINNHNIHFTSMFLLDMIATVDGHKSLPISLGEFCSTFANGVAGDPPMGNPQKNSAAKDPFIGWRKKYTNLCTRYSRMRGDLHLTDEEKSRNVMKDQYGAGTYWVVAPSAKRDATTKMWDWRKMNEVVDYFKGRITFVTIGKSSLLNEKLKNVVDLTDRFNEDLRGLFSLVYHADGCVSGPSALMHLCAAIPFRKVKINEDGKGSPILKSARRPGVIILGGQEPSAWSWYCEQHTIHSNGVWKCCPEGGCWRSRIHAMPKDPKHNRKLCDRTVVRDGRFVQGCMDAIRASDVIRTIERVYEGDMYEYEKPGKAETLQKITDSWEPVVRRNAKRNSDILTTEDASKVGRNMMSLVAPNAPEQAVEEGTELSKETVDGIFEAGDRVFFKADTHLLTEKDTVHNREINIVGNLNSKGGGEQSLLTIGRMLRQAGWKVNVHPWGKVNINYRDEELMDEFEGGPLGGTMEHTMKEGIPLLFYANDRVWDFTKKAEAIVAKSSAVVIGINFANGDLPRCGWLDKTRKLRMVVFQNREKREDWERSAIGFEYTKRVELYGAIDLERYLRVCPAHQGSEVVVLKHCVPDHRKYVTLSSEKGGDRPHIWQKHLSKELDTKFYARLLKDTKQTRFEFMEAHEEVVKAFAGEPRMVFHKWDDMPVHKFLERGDVYLYRTSNHWRDQYPRVVAEALASGLPVLTEPRDGTGDRVRHGDTGFHCVDYDGFLYALKMLQRKPDYRKRMGREAKDWARENLRPEKWVDTLEEAFYG